ncbi:TIGR02678 family protein, partial [Thiorhodococcus mannitoliphagus]|nr:TIGR02678 family protein [Thiorhodococcus mannitoliphagus]
MSQIGLESNHELGDRLTQLRDDERRRAMRGLLMQPLLYADHP